MAPELVQRGSIVDQSRAEQPHLHDQHDEGIDWIGLLSTRIAGGDLGAAADLGRLVGERLERERRAVVRHE